jgi:Tfp pilus assembly protein PilN
MKIFFTNLLPMERRHLLVREYYFRLIVIVVALGILLLGASAILLLPTYLFLAGSAQEKDAELAHVTATLASADEISLSTRLAALSNDAAAIIALSKNPSVSAALRAALAIPRPGVSLSGLTYTPDTKATTLLLTGTASTRDSLRAYQLALEGMPGATSVTLPVSVYAKDTAIPFVITLLLKP